MSDERIRTKWGLIDWVILIVLVAIVAGGVWWK